MTLEDFDDASEFAEPPDRNRYDDAEDGIDGYLDECAARGFDGAGNLLDEEDRQLIADQIDADAMRWRKRAREIVAEIPAPRYRWQSPGERALDLSGAVTLLAAEMLSEYADSDWSVSAEEFDFDRAAREFVCQSL